MGEKKKENFLMRNLATVLFGAALLSSFTNAPPALAGDATVLGTGIGAAVGGVLGSEIGHGGGRLLSTTLGVAVGATVGNEIGQEIDREPHHRYREHRYGYVPTTYSGPISYYSYAPNYVAPPAPPTTYVDPHDERYCRPYSQEIRIDGRVEESYGTACLQPDGTWRVVQ